MQRFYKIKHEEKLTVDGPAVVLVRIQFNFSYSENHLRSKQCLNSIVKVSHRSRSKYFREKSEVMNMLASIDGIKLALLLAHIFHPFLQNCY